METVTESEGLRKETKTTVTGEIRKSTKTALHEEIARREAIAREAIGGNATVKVSMSALVGEIIEGWRTSKEAKVTAETEA